MNEIIELTQEVSLQQPASLPLSPEQQSLFGRREQTSFPALTLVMQINGQLDQPRLQRAVQQVLKNQRILGNKFFNVVAYRGLRQSVVRADNILPIEKIEVGSEQTKGQDLWQIFTEQIEAKRQAGFIQDADWLSTLYLCQIDEQCYGLALVVADLITDNGGLQAFWHALTAAYKADALLTKDEELPQYAEYVEWRVDVAQDEDAIAGKEYWQQQLSEEMQAPALPYRMIGFVGADNDDIVVKEKALTYASEITTIDSTLQGQLDKLAQQVEQPVTLLLQAAWWWLLARLSDQKTIQVGWSHDCRQDYEFFADNLGLFEKILPLSLTVTPEQTFSSWLETIAELLEDHQAWQEHWSIESLATTKHLASGFGLRDNFTDKLTPESKWTVISVKGIELPFELSLLVGQLNGKPNELELRYQCQYYSAADISILLKQYLTLLMSLTGSLTTDLVNKANRLADVSLAQLSSNEAFISKTELSSRQHFTASAQNKEVSAHSTIADYISSWAQTKPTGIALTGDNSQVTYAQLEEKVQQLAIRLHHQGVKAESIVALALPRTIDLVVAILATWRVGAAWVPLDLQWPMLRKRLIVEQSSAMLIISNSVHWTIDTTDETQDSAEVLLLDEPSNKARENVDFTAANLQQAAYIIFTSGSTGTPKGVVIEHSQLVNYVISASKQLGLGDCKSFAMTSTVAADLGHTSLFGALFNGATLHIASDEEVQDSARFAQFMQTHQIDCLKIVPSHLNALLDLDLLKGKSILPSTLVLGGEPIPASLVKNIFSALPQCRLFNHYGPTETTVGVLYHQLHIDEDMQQGISLSQTFEGCQITIFDEKMQRVPTGAIGELYIGGKQLCRGYLSAEVEGAFVEDPFNSGERLYRSGDLARYLPNGSLQLCGRQDHQVKIRGFRIELAEIEQILLNEATIGQAVVCTWQPGESHIGESKDASSRQLIAYVQRNSQGEHQQSNDDWLQSIIEHLPKVLPATMLPAHVFVLDNIPRLANGKIDRNNLPSPESLLVNCEFIEPSSALETLLAEEMAMLLNVKKISTQRSFFSLGGHSLLIIKLVSRLRRQLQVDIHPGVVFDHPSVVELAKAMSNQEGVIPEKLERSAQVRLKLNSLTPEQREALLTKSKAAREGTN